MSFAWFLASPGQAHACKCAVPGTPAEELEKFSAVFAGRVVSVRHSYDLNAASYTPDDRTTVGFEVSAVWKGTVHEGHVHHHATNWRELRIHLCRRGRIRRLCSTTAPMATTATPLAYAVERRSSDKHKLTSTRSERVVLPRPERAVQRQKTTTGFGRRWGVDHHPGRCCDSSCSGRGRGVPKSQASLGDASRSPRASSSSSASAGQRACTWPTQPKLLPQGR